MDLLVLIQKTRQEKIKSHQTIEPPGMFSIVESDLFPLFMKGAEIINVLY